MDGSDTGTSALPSSTTQSVAGTPADRAGGNTHLFEELEGLVDHPPDIAHPDLSDFSEPQGSPSHVSLVIGECREAFRLHSNINKVTVDHQALLVRTDQAYEYCNEQRYQLIWIITDNPTSNDILGLPAFIRYVSKKNQNTTVIGVASNASSVDPRAEGIDEIVPRPVRRSVIRGVYAKWTPVHLLLDCVDTDEDDLSLQTPSTPATPATPATPCTPTTPASDETDRSSFSISLDSGIESPPAFQLLGNQLPSADSIRSLIGASRSAASNSSKMKAADHTTKEKLRRERIKDSCDQLRVLLPYIRGRKTDMASILEMCVDYLQIINAFMPQALQDQIVDILSKDPNLVPNKDLGQPRPSKHESKAMQSTSHPIIAPVADSCHASPHSQCSTPNMNMKKSGSILYVSGSQTPNAKRDLTCEMDGKVSKRKRGNHQAPGDNLISGETTGCSPFVASVVPSTASMAPMGQFDGRVDSCGIIHEDIGQLSYSFHTTPPATQCHTKTYPADLENTYSRIYGNGTGHNSDGFVPSTLFTSYLGAKSQTVERESFGGMYMDNSLYQYYSGIHSNVGSHLYSGQDYVNPNSILSVPGYSSAAGARHKAEFLKQEDSCGPIAASDSVNATPGNSP